MTHADTSFDVIVVGGGPAGLAAAIALSQTGARTALVARQAPYADNRTTALLGGSVDFLDEIGVWALCRDRAAGLKTMRLVDDTGRLIRAPEVRFVADEIGIEVFGYNIANAVLVEALERRAGEIAELTRIAEDAESVSSGAEAVTVTTGSGRVLTAQLVVGADGRHSLCREAAGIGVSRRALQQSALTFNITHARPHHNVSTEFHTSHGPCVFVPLPGDRSSVVWVAAPREAERLHALDDDELSAAAERQSHSIFGRVHVEPGRHVFPLAIERPQAYAQNRIVLIGEAAHVVPPIGAQGLNLGLRDGIDIADVVRKAKAAGEDLGASQVISRYGAARRADILSRTFAIDVANRSLLSDLLPMQSLRAVGMHLMGGIGPLRRLAMREGLAPSWRSSRRAG
ncbi:putative FAD-dependent monoxygenase; putative 2-octaprenyl-6-mehtoxyphenol hydroxylase [Bradyrhizobium sp. ORS 285]|uniref:UbiH/UbiF family hydroxylase n=1 Tax=Bradyrhizobium sp. ORS 285 TaxID=115808 RepID=UPI0002408A4B|nr:UbiH/UbiF family hydroxylase [Bradyrhizobium sp. ORS 285]CCD88632.1 putative FAD-dependent monoxygenase; 2-octaprenyl-6-mehtoxyphenol hydroxylase [Bradyrhizobium sp. ORS 285]SMX58565.1 putative FAD-dependent monoxygenase; putative 2-octaprenyl-6-mehtoxyphenol hydroxylase [Bradyrhizobium sp. ORS 285]